MSAIAATEDDIDTLTRTLFGEARGEPDDGKAAVGWVARNRATWVPSAWWGNTIKGVCLKGWQFSCWNINDPNRAKMLALATDDPLYSEFRRIAEGVIAGTILDPTAEIGGATQYKVASTKASWDFAVASLPSKTIGHQIFWCLPPN